MATNASIEERLDALYTAGREMVERDQIHGTAVTYQFDVCTFDAWRRKVNDLLYELRGCDDIFYQRFSKEVTKPAISDLEKGLRILGEVRGA